MANPASQSDGFYFGGAMPPAASVQIFTYDDEDPDPVATLTIALTSGGEFVGTVTAGDRYRANVLDASGLATGAARLTAFGTSTTGVVAAFPTVIVGAPAGQRDMYTFVLQSEMLALDGTIEPAPGENPIAKLRYSWIQTGRIVTFEEMTVTTTASGCVLVDHDVPVFDTGCGYVALLVRDAAGEPVAASWGGTSTTSMITYASQPIHGGVLFQACAGGFDETKWCKKTDKADTLYSKKLGLATPSFESNEWCFDCPKDEAPGAGADVPTDRVRITEPREVYCAGDGIAAGNGKVYITCQERINLPNEGWAARRKAADEEAGEQEDENLPTRSTGVTYKFFAFESTEDASGKEVHDLTWYQTVKGTVAYKSPSGDGSIQLTGGTYVWDDGTLGGGTQGTSDHSYPHQQNGRSLGGGAGANDWKGMSDSPQVQVPQTDSEAQRLACTLGITGDAKGDWTEITTTLEFHTILVCCATDEILAVYEWTETVTIKKAGANSYTSSASATGVTHQGNTPPAEWPAQFPC